MLKEINIGPMTIHLYGLMVAIGFLCAYFITDYRGKKRGMDENVIFGILWCAILGGLMGSRCLYYIVELPSIIKDPSILWDFRYGYVVYGGIIGGVFLNQWYCKHKKVSFWEYFDLVMPAVALAQGFGRIGCFFAGCCYGRETDSAFAIIFPEGSSAPAGIPLLPTQLISSAGNFIFAAVLFFYGRKKRKNGQVAALYLLFYSVGRFVIEFFRNDYRGSIGALSTSQLISIAILVVGIVLELLSSRGVFEREEAE